MGGSAPQQAGSPGDILDLLLACFALLEPPRPQAPPPRYAPPSLDVWTLAEALHHLQAQLQQHPAGGALEHFVPAREGSEAGELRRRSGVASTFLAGLELAKQGRVVLQQQENFGALQVRLSADAGAPAAV